MLILQVGLQRFAGLVKALDWSELVPAKWLAVQGAALRCKACAMHAFKGDESAGLPCTAMHSTVLSGANSAVTTGVGMHC